MAEVEGVACKVVNRYGGALHSLAIRSISCLVGLVRVER